MIKFNKKNMDFPVIDFVSRAVRKKTKNDYSRYESLYYIMANDNEIVSTDTYRIHIAQNKSYTDKILLSPGYYEIVKKTKSEIIIVNIEKDMVFPQYQQTFEPYKEIAENDMDISGSNPNFLFSSLIRKQDSGAFNYKYLEDLTPFMSSFYWGDSKKPVYFVNGGTKKALLMPILYK